jgi:aminopeptidase YwaD
VKRILLLLTFFICLTDVIFGQQTKFGSDKKYVSERLKIDIYTLASDSFMGREVGTKGEILAKNYIVDKFKEAGIKPYFGDTTYIQPFKLSQKFYCIHARNFLDVNNVIYDVNYDFSPIVYSSDDSVSGELCYVKFGITAPDLNYDDYKDRADLKDKIFVIELSVPGTYKKNSKFIPYSSIAYKIDLAIKHGAKGIIFINSDKRYPYEPVNLVSGFKKFKIPIIYFYGKLDEIMPQSASNIPAIIKTEISSDNSGTGYNVAGFINNNAQLTVVVGGHYDHLGMGGVNSMSPGVTKIHKGADDNASGTAGVIELARFLNQSEMKKFNYLFITFSGEESGLLGSEFFVKSQEFKKLQVNYMINLDMIGRLDSIKNRTEVWAAGSSRKWKSLLKTESPEALKFKIIKGSLRDSDHYPFYQNHIPVIFFFTGLHHDYHRPTDTPDKVNYPGEAEIVVYLEKMIKQLETQDRLKYRKVGIFGNSSAMFYTIIELIDSLTTKSN